MKINNTNLSSTHTRKMKNYIIFPQTTIQGYEIEQHKGVKNKKCRELCDEKRECKAFSFKDGFCKLHSNAEDTKFSNGTSTYVQVNFMRIKWIPLLLFILLLILLCYCMCA